MSFLQGYKLDSSYTQKIWDTHYTKSKSQLTYPDENLVRILTKLTKSYANPSNARALDLGAGSGRHTILLKHFGYQTFAIDYSQESIDRIKSLIPETQSWKIENLPYPIETNSLDLVVCWGMLHYNSHNEIKAILQEIKRILKPNGYLVGTLRSDKDTHLLKGSQTKVQLTDLKDAYVQLFSEESCINLFKEFKDFKLGYMERTPMGELESRIAHHIFQCIS